MISKLGNGPTVRFASAMCSIWVFAGQPRPPIQKHAAGTADAHSARVTPGQRGIEVVLYVVQAVEDSHALAHGNLVGRDIWCAITFRVVPRYVKDGPSYDVAGFWHGYPPASRKRNAMRYNGRPGAECEEPKSKGQQKDADGPLDCRLQRELKQHGA